MTISFWSWSSWRSCWVLLGLERQALEARDRESRERAELCRDARKKFFEHHLAWWAPTFCRLIALEDPDGYYGAVAGFLPSFIAAERAILDVASPTTTARPNPMERPEECGGCMHLVT